MFKTLDFTAHNITINYLFTYYLNQPNKKSFVYSLFKAVHCCD